MSDPPSLGTVSADDEGASAGFADMNVVAGKDKSPHPPFAENGWASVSEGLTLVMLGTFVFVPAELAEIIVASLRQAGIWEIALQTPVVRALFVIASLLSGMMLLMGRLVACGIPRQTDLRPLTSASCLFLTYHLLCTASLAMNWPSWSPASAVFVNVSSRLAQLAADVSFLIFLAGIAHLSDRRNLKTGTNQLIALGAGIAAVSLALEIMKVQIPRISAIMLLPAALACAWWLRWYSQFLATLIDVIDSARASASQTQVTAPDR